MEIDEGSAIIQSKEKPYCCTIRVPLPSKQLAIIAKTTLEVDPELQPQKIDKTFSIADETTLRVDFAATEIRLLRVAVSSIFDMIRLVVQTQQEFATLEHLQ